MQITKTTLARKTSQIAWSIFRTVLIIGLAFAIIQPLLIKLSSSFKGSEDLYNSSVFLIPKHFTLDNYIKVWDFIDYPLRFLNSVLYAAACGLLQAASCSLAAYGMARFKFRGRGVVFALALFTLVIPPQFSIISQFLIFKSFGPATLFSLGTVMSGVDLTGPLPLLLLSATATGFKNGLYIYMLRQYFKNLPKEFEEAAYIDGCGRFRTFLQVIMPGAASMTMTVFLLAFVWQWNDYLYVSSLAPGLNVFNTVISSVGSQINSASFIHFASGQGMLYDAAAMILFILPLLILYLFVQRVFVQGIEKSGIVG